MKFKVIAVIVLVVAGIGVSASLETRKAAAMKEYRGYVEVARRNAEKEIPYVAVQNYRRAIQMDASDEALYKEYMEQCRNLGEDYYADAVKAYITYFPESSEAYENLCEYYYDTEMYQFVLTSALEAREKGIATEQIRDRYLECCVMYRVIASGFEEVNSFLGETARVKMSGLYGYINGSGSYKLLPIYEDASYFLKGTTAVFHEDEWYMMNEAGYKVARTDEAVDSLNFMNNDLVLFSKGGKCDYMTSSLSVPDEVRFDQATNFKNGVAAVQKDEKWALISSEGNLITDYMFEDVKRDEYNTCISNGIIFAKYKGKYYMVNAEGNKISETGFDDAYSFVGSEPAAVCVDGKWGFVDAEGKMVIEPQYENAKSFEIGLGAVCKGGLWGYIDSNNAARIEYQYQDCLPFSANGITAVCEEGVWSYIKLLPYIN